MREIEAEVVACLAAARAGLTPRSAEHLKGIAEKSQALNVNIDIIVRAAARIERLAGLRYGKLTLK